MPCDPSHRRGWTGEHNENSDICPQPRQESHSPRLSKATFIIWAPTEGASQKCSQHQGFAELVIIFVASFSKLHESPCLSMLRLCNSVILDTIRNIAGLLVKIFSIIIINLLLNGFHYSFNIYFRVPVISLIKTRDGKQNLQSSTLLAFCIGL